MAISNTHSAVSYNALRLALFRQWEGDDQELIFDTNATPKATIGIERVTVPGRGFGVIELGILK